MIEDPLTTGGPLVTTGLLTKGDPLATTGLLTTGGPLVTTGLLTAGDPLVTTGLLMADDPLTTDGRGMINGQRTAGMRPTNARLPMIGIRPTIGIRTINLSVDHLEEVLLLETLAVMKGIVIQAEMIEDGTHLVVRKTTILTAETHKIVILAIKGQGVGMPI